MRKEMQDTFLKSVPQVALFNQGDDLGAELGDKAHEISEYRVYSIPHRYLICGYDVGLIVRPLIEELPEQVSAVNNSLGQILHVILPSTAGSLYILLFE